MKCIYHNDLDGKCSAHWVHRNVGIYDNEIVKWTPDRLLEVREKIRNSDLQGLLIAPELLS